MVIGSTRGRRRCSPAARLELAALTAALDTARAGEPQVVLIQGEAGIGKSSLVCEFLGGQPGVPVVTVSGEEAEAFLPYGLVQQLAAGAAAVSADALAGLELLCQGPGADADPLTAGVELLALISSLQGSEAVAVVIEDLQWIDLASARTLLFACRRLSADRVLVVLTCRTGGLSQLGEGWERFVSGDRRATRLTLDGLDVDELGMLCRALGRTGLSGRTFRRLRQHTGGNPLLARALLAELTDEALTAIHGSWRAPQVPGGSDPVQAGGAPAGRARLRGGRISARGPQHARRRGRAGGHGRPGRGAGRGRTGRNSARAGDPVRLAGFLRASARPPGRIWRPRGRAAAGASSACRCDRGGRGVARSPDRRCCRRGPGAGQGA